ncbi:hypothetical protein MPER_04018, partial [Moniliophthora perniciosa FA553]
LCYTSHGLDVQLYIAQLTTWIHLLLNDLGAKGLPSVPWLALPEETKSQMMGISRPHGRISTSCSSTPYPYMGSPSLPTLLSLPAWSSLRPVQLKGRKDTGSMEVRGTAASWPDYLRSKTGVSAAYSFTIFSKHLHPQLSSYIQIMGDANRFIELTNDILSFYKENLAGETNNYISTRAFTRRKSTIQTHQELTEEAISTHERICATLEGPELEAWKIFVNGYLAFHVMQERYRLGEILSLGD